MESNFSDEVRSQLTTLTVALTNLTQTVARLENENKQLRSEVREMIHVLKHHQQNTTATTNNNHHEAQDSNPQRAPSVPIPKGNQENVVMAAGSGNTSATKTTFSTEAALQMPFGGGHRCDPRPMLAAQRLKAEGSRVSIGTKSPSIDNKNECDQNNRGESSSDKAAASVVMELNQVAALGDFNAVQSLLLIPLLLSPNAGTAAATRNANRGVDERIHMNAIQTSSVYAAAQNGHLEVVKYLLNEFGSNAALLEMVTTVDGNNVKSSGSTNSAKGGTALHVACEKGHFDVVKVITECVEPSIVRSLHHLEGQLSSSSSFPSPPLAVTGTAAANTTIKKSALKMTPLHLAAKNDHATIVRFLVKECNIPVDLREFSGNNAAIISSGISSSSDHGRTALHMAAYYACSETLRVLVEELGADVNAVDSEGRTPMRYGAEEGYLDDVGIAFLQTRR